MHGQQARKKAKEPNTRMYETRGRTECLESEAAIPRTKARTLVRQHQNKPPGSAFWFETVNRQDAQFFANTKSDVQTAQPLHGAARVVRSAFGLVAVSPSALHTTEVQRATRTCLLATQAGLRPAQTTTGSLLLSLLSPAAARVGYGIYIILLQLITSTTARLAQL